MKAGAVYAALVFVAGFALGIVRELALAPLLGRRAAELVEMPWMLAVMAMAARWTVRRLGLAPVAPRRLGMGLIALGLLMTAEIALVLPLRGVSPADYIATRDPVAGTAYLLMLGLFAIMPALVARD